MAAYFSAFARIDVLVHAVGYVHQGTIEECGPEDGRRSVGITLDSACNVIAGAVPKMKAHGGSIVTIGSVASSIKGFPRRAAYGAAKGGVIGLTKAVAADYVSFGIRCNSVCPGTVASPSLEERIGELGETLGSRQEAYRAFISRSPPAASARWRRSPGSAPSSRRTRRPSSRGRRSMSMAGSPSEGLERRANRGILAAVREDVPTWPFCRRRT